MSTFKITVDDQSDLGKHISKFKPRERSREIYLLATIGLMASRGNILTDKTHGLNVEFNSNERKSSSVAVGILTSNELSEENEKNIIVNHALAVDFGDDLLAL